MLGWLTVENPHIFNWAWMSYVLLTEVHLGTHCNRTVAEVHVYTAEPPLMDTPYNRQPLYNRCPKHLHVCCSQLQISVCVYVIMTTTFLSVAISTPH